MPRRLAAGNWKMNGHLADMAELSKIATDTANLDVDVLICPPATLLATGRNIGLLLGGQDCHANAKGAHTGDISASMLADAGAAYVIVGHSERRSDHAEQDADINAKAAAAHDAGLTAIICIGETLDQRETGNTLDVILGQLAGSVPHGATALNTVIAYEPVWAIGTGKVPSLAQIAQVHAAIRTHLQTRFETGADIPLLYGGSVKASNAAEIFAIPEVNGALVGGASLKAADFTPIVQALAAS